MPYRCCVPGCKGNYNSTETKVSVFKFPSDHELCEKWIRAIHRDFVPTKSSRVCQLHFHDVDIEKETSIYDSQTGEKLTAPLRIPRLKANAVPSLLPGCPSYLSSTVSECERETPSEKACRLDNEHLNLAIKRSKETKEAEDIRNYFCDYKGFLKGIKETKLSSAWTLVHKEDCTLILNINSFGVPCIVSSLSISKELELRVFFRSVELKICRGRQFPKLTNSFQEISALLEHLETLSSGKVEDKQFCFELMESCLDNLTDEQLQEKKHFLKEQIELLKYGKNQMKYSPQFMIFAALMHSISPHAYKFLRNSKSITLPHPTTIRRIISNLNNSPQGEQLDGNFLKYISDKVKHLSDQDKIVVLMMDEIHLKPYFDFKGGNVVGAAFDSNQAATSAHSFMIQSLLSNYKDVVFLLPVKTITAETLHDVVKRVIIGLEEKGFTVVAVASDNNSINRKAMSFFSNPPQILTCYVHPVDPERSLFFVIDAVHIFKCIRNNWINQKNDGQCMYYPNFNCLEDHVIKKLDTASFRTMKELHDLEHTNIVKFGYGLTLKALNPSNLERQNVKLVLQVFNEHVILALNELGGKHNLNHCKQTAAYIDTILKWWYVVNVKTPNKGKRLKNVLMEPLTNSPLDQRRIFLQQLVAWLNIWQDCKCSTGTLTSETHKALVHTSCALLEMSTYCIEKLKMTYFLSGKVQTDSLEERFGKYRMLAGSQYNISVRQLFESESKLRLQNSLPLTLKSGKYGDIKVTKLDLKESEMDSNGLTDTHPIFISVSETDFTNINSILPILVYLAGYCVYTVCKNLKCSLCEEQLTMDKDLAIDDCFEHIVNLNRGGLKFPNADVVKIVSYTYIVCQKLVSPEHESTFLKTLNQRSFMFEQVLALITEHEDFDDLSICSDHLSRELVKRFIWTTTNILLNNYCNSKNDMPKKVPKKRKLQTIQN